MNPRILIVNDSPLTRESLRQVLEAEDYEVEAVAETRLALERLRAGPYQLLVTDHRMPEIDGIALLGAVRTSKIPCGVIVLTAPWRSSTGPGLHEGRGRRLRRSTVRSRPIRAPGSPDPGTAPADRRTGTAPQPAPRGLPVSQHPLEEPEDAADLRPDQARRAARLDHPDLGRDRHRQGADRPGDPCVGHPPRRPVRRPELRGVE